MNDLWRLWRLWRPYRGWMYAGFGIALVTLLANVTLLAISGWFITAMAVAGAAGATMNYFTPAAIIRASAIARTLGRYLERLISHDATLRQLSGLRLWFYQHLEPLAPARLQQFHSGDLLSRIRADIDALDNFYVRALLPSLVALVASLGFFLFVAFYDAGMALWLLALLILTGALLPLAGRHLGAAAGRRLIETEGRLRVAAIDGTQGLAELLVHGAADSHARHLRDLGIELGEAQRRMTRLTALTQSLTLLLAHLALLGVLWLGIPLLHAGHLAPPQLAMLALLALASFEAVAPLPAAFAHLEATLTAARRLFAIVDTEPAAVEPAHPAPLPTSTDLRFEAVDFRYPGTAGAALEQFDLTLPAGRRLAIVGPTGAGKTTVFNLLLRFWEPQAGTIRLGGTPLAELSGEALRRRIALVSQQTHLFNASIRDNLLLADPDATPDALETACRRAQVHEFIASLPEGYDTWAGETGVRVSGGQARRIAIARALLKDAPILLLDEPTEGLDGATERALMEALVDLMAGRTTLMITHRPLALAAMDEIIVLDQGCVRERGTHRELLRQSLYPRLLGLNPAV